MQEVISIKGSKEGLRMLIDESAEWQDVMSALQTQLERTGSFFVGARLVVDIGDRLLSEEQLAQVLQLMQQNGLQPDSLAATARESRNAARVAGLTARPTQRDSAVWDTKPVEGESSFVNRTVRSGQVVRHHGHITILGDVNPGGQIIAGGSVVVWGRLRGLVHAGALGDANALVCALDLRPTQLRIASLIARTPEGASSHVPEIARIEQDYIIVESWEEYKRV